MAMKRRNFLKTLGAGTAGIAAFSCTDQEAAGRIAAGQGLHPGCRPHLDQGALPLLRHRAAASRSA